jgi:UDP-perosamine 4-acetyltransferase
VDRIVGIGAGGHARIMIEILLRQKKYELTGLLDKRQKLWSSKVMDVPVIGSDELLPRLYANGIRKAFIGIGTIDPKDFRKHVFEKVRNLGFEIVPVIHPQSIISSSVKMGVGPTIMAGAIVNTAAVLGDNVIINSGAIVEHDCIVGSHVHVAPGARLAGMVTVDEGAHIGLGASVLQKIRIGSHALVGAGALATKDVPDNAKVLGIPARQIVEN